MEKACERDEFHELSSGFGTQMHAFLQEICVLRNLIDWPIMIRSKCQEIPSLNKQLGVLLHVFINKSYMSQFIL